jgi:hypothetical protein
VNDLPTAVAALAQLNRIGDHTAIANHLRKRGIRGIYDNGIACPVARYVHAETGGRTVLISASVWMDDDEDATYRGTPDNVSDFVQMFDMRQYPDLIDEDAS